MAAVLRHDHAAALCAAHRCVRARRASTSARSAARVLRAALSAAPATVSAMAKVSDCRAFECSECGWRSAKWAGRCGECQAWGSVAEARTSGPAAAARRTGRGCRSGRDAAVRRPCPIGAGGRRPRPGPGPPAWASWTGCWAAGWSPARVVLLAGEPGVGKSTLLLEAGALAARSGPGALRDRRGVGGPGPAARRPDRRDQRQPVPGRGDRLRRAARRTSRPSTRALLIVDSVQTISAAGRRGRAGRGHPGPRDHRGADRAGQAAHADAPCWSAT